MTGGTASTPAEPANGGFHLRLLGNFTTYLGVKSQQSQQQNNKALYFSQLYKLARTMQFSWHLAERFGGKTKGNKIMAIRYEDFSRYAFSLLGAAAFTAVLIANTVGMGPVA
jgi:hypothetical protein